MKPSESQIRLQVIVSSFAWTCASAMLLLAYYVLRERLSFNVSMVTLSVPLLIVIVWTGRFLLERRRESVCNLFVSMAMCAVGGAAVIVEFLIPTNLIGSAAIWMAVNVVVGIARAVLITSFAKVTV